MRAIIASLLSSAIPGHNRLHSYASPRCGNTDFPLFFRETERERVTID